MNDFTEELKRSLSELEEASDAELLRVFEEADYAFYRTLDQSIFGLLQEGSFAPTDVQTGILELPLILTIDVPLAKTLFHSMSFSPTVRGLAENPKEDLLAA